MLSTDEAIIEPLSMPSYKAYNQFTCAGIEQKCKQILGKKGMGPPPQNSDSCDHKMS